MPFGASILLMVTLSFIGTRTRTTYVYNSLTTDISLVYPQGIEGSRVNISKTYRVSRLDVSRD